MKTSFSCTTGVLAIHFAKQIWKDWCLFEGQLWISTRILLKRPLFMLVTLRTNVLAHTLNTYVLYIIYIILVISYMCLHALNMYTCIKYAYMHIYIHDIAIILICMLCVHKSVFNVWFWWTADMSVLCYIDSIVILYFKPCNMHEPRTTHQPRWVMSDLDLPIINPLPCKWIVTWAVTKSTHVLSSKDVNVRWLRES